MFICTKDSVKIRIILCNALFKYVHCKRVSENKRLLRDTPCPPNLLIQSLIYSDISNTTSSPQPRKEIK